MRPRALETIPDDTLLCGPHFKMSLERDAAGCPAGKGHILIGRLCRETTLSKHIRRRKEREVVCSPSSCLHLCGLVCSTESWLPCTPGLCHLVLSATASEAGSCMALFWSLEVGGSGRGAWTSSLGLQCQHHVDPHGPTWRLVAMAAARAEQAIWGLSGRRSQRIWWECKVCLLRWARNSFLPSKNFA